MLLSIIIVSWNTREMLADCLQSVADTASDLDPQIVVVDNNSTDGSQKMLAAQFPSVQLIANDKNVGFGAANNQALTYCTGHYVLLLNSDTVVYPNCFQQLITYLDQNPQVAAVGPRLLNADGTLQPSCHPFHTPSRELWRMMHGDRWRNRSEYNMTQWNLVEPRQVEVIKGACMMLRGEALSTMPLFDESFFFYSEEVDLCYRLYQAGWKLMWLPTAELLHYGGASSSLVPLRTFQQLYDGKLYYFRKHYGRLAGWYYKLVLVASVVSRLALMPIGVLFRPKQRKRYLTLGNYYIHLMRELPSM